MLYVNTPITVKVQIDNPLLFIDHCTDSILTIGLDRVMSVHSWRGSTPEYDPPFSFLVEKKRSKPRRVGVHFAVGLTILPFFFAVSHCERFVLSAGHWDNSFRVTALDTNATLVHSISQHKDIVTCVAVGELGDVVVTGSKDATVMVWEVVRQDAPLAVAAGASGAGSGSAAGGGGSGVGGGVGGGSGSGAGSALASAAFESIGGGSAGASAVSGAGSAAGAVGAGSGGASVGGVAGGGGVGGGGGSSSYLYEKPRHILYGHDDEVTCVAVNSDLDVVVSGSKDGSCIIHTLKRGRYVRSIYPPDSGPLRWVGISSTGNIVTYSLVTTPFLLIAPSACIIRSHGSDYVCCSDGCADGHELACVHHKRAPHRQCRYGRAPVRSDVLGRRTVPHYRRRAPHYHDSSRSQVLPRLHLACASALCFGPRLILFCD